MRCARSCVAWHPITPIHTHTNHWDCTTQTPQVIGKPLRSRELRIGRSKTRLAGQRTPFHVLRTYLGSRSYSADFPTANTTHILASMAEEFPLTINGAPPPPTSIRYEERPRTPDRQEDGPMFQLTPEMSVLLERITNPDKHISWLFL